MMKCFQRLVKEHIVSSLPPTFHPFQFAYRRNRSTEDAISAALHLSLGHLEEKNTHDGCCSWTSVQLSAPSSHSI